jgi:hypothetical protein
MNTILSNYWVLFAAIWMFANGVLHDIFVLIKHKGPYDRDLLRLLMDGHLLIVSGILFLLGFLMMQSKVQYGPWLTLVTAVSILVYCAMIFPFLKSFATAGISVIVLVISIKALLQGTGLAITNN